jgi:HPt (histidine-containing phosphotransfer) domain-containing protein
MIDRSRFEEYSRFFDKELMAEIIDVFIREYPARIELLNKNLNDLDFPTLAENTHALKGAISNFMAPVPVTIAQKLEEMAKTKDTEHLSELLIELKSALDIMISELQIIRQEFIS